MASKNSPSSLVSGLGMAMAFIQALVNEIVRLGGFEEMLHILSSERGKDIITKLAQVIVESPWRVPRTLVEKLARAESAEMGYSQEDVECDSRFNWDIIGLQKTFTIPVIGFSDDAGTLPISPEILNQLRTGEIRYPLLVFWENEPHVVVLIDTTTGNSLQTGQRFPNLELARLNIAPAKFFDLDR